MKDYQPTKNNKYLLPTAVWNQTVWMIRDYDRMKEKADDVISLSSTLSGDGIRGSGISDPTARMAEKREVYLHKVDLIDIKFIGNPKGMNAIKVAARTDSFDDTGQTNMLMLQHVGRSFSA